MSSRTLFVVRFRGSQWQKARPLTPLDHYHGWADRNYADEPLKVYHNDGSSEEVIVNEGHELGSLRQLVASHVLTWNPQPGDTIEAVIPVNFYGGKAHCSSTLSNRRNGCCFRFRITTVLGRHVSLGEDMAEDAFGHDALLQTLEAALRGDWRDQLCELEVIEDDLSAELPPDIEVSLPPATENA